MAKKYGLANKERKTTMNGYKLLADSYRKVLEKTTNKDEKKKIELSIKALDYLSTVDQEDLLELFSTGAFNSILIAYSKKAMENCAVPREKIMEVMNEMKWLLDTADVYQITNTEKQQ